jgi:hypothetical protein
MDAPDGSHMCDYSNCKQIGKFKQCRGCKSVRYCGVLCQKAAWKKHRSICKAIQEALEWERVYEAFVRYSNFRRENLHKIESQVLIAYDELRDRLVQFPNVDLFALKDFTSVINGRSGNAVLWNDFIARLSSFRMKIAIKKLKKININELLS